MTHFCWDVREPARPSVPLLQGRVCVVLLNVEEMGGYVNNLQHWEDPLAPSRFIQQQCSSAVVELRTSMTGRNCFAPTVLVQQTRRVETGCRKAHHFSKPFDRSFRTPNSHDWRTPHTPHPDRPHLLLVEEQDLELAPPSRRTAAGRGKRWRPEAVPLAPPTFRL